MHRVVAQLIAERRVYELVLLDERQPLELGCHDGRVEVLVIGTPQQLRELRTLLERGPRFSNVTEVREELASPDPQYDQVFVIGHGD